MAVPSFLARERSVARPGFNRWLIPPAALAVHLCIGQAYATSVYTTALVKHFDSSLTAIGIVFSIAIVMLGLSAAVLGTWVERSGPRKSMLTAALCPDYTNALRTEESSTVARLSKLWRRLSSGGYAATLRDAPYEACWSVVNRLCIDEWGASIEQSVARTYTILADGVSRLRARAGPKRIEIRRSWPRSSD